MIKTIKILGYEERMKQINLEKEGNRIIIKQRLASEGLEKLDRNSETPKRKRKRGCGCSKKKKT